MTKHQPQDIDFNSAHWAKKAAARRGDFARLPYGPDNDRHYRMRKIEEVLRPPCAELTAHHLAHLRDSDIPAIGAMLKDFGTEGRAMGFTARRWLGAGHLAMWIGGRLDPALAGLMRIVGQNAEIEAEYARWRAEAEDLRKRVKCAPAASANKQTVVLASEIAFAKELLCSAILIVENCERVLSASRSVAAR